MIFDMGYQRNYGACEVSACDRPATVKGMCQAHYGRMRAAGDSRETALLYPAVKARAPYVSAGEPCSMQNCDVASTRRGFCDRHYSNARYRELADPGRGEFVYLADAPGWTPPGVMKIGYGTAARLKDFRTTLPTARFVREERVEFPNRVEALLHHVLRNRKVSGEWFRVTPEEFDAALRLTLAHIGQLDPMRYDVGRQARSLGIPQVP